MTTRRTLRNCISVDENELVIYGADNFSQFPHRNDSMRSKCERALAAANSCDLVVLRTRLDQDYYTWLRSCGLGSEHYVEYGASAQGMTLSELIVENPDPVLKIINKIGRKPVYVPWFSGHMETLAANSLGAELFGAPESLTLKYNDKANFKSICQALEIPVVHGKSLEIHPDNKGNFEEMNSCVEHYLKSSATVLIRGTLGESGISLYKTTGSNLSELYELIVKSGEKEIIIEPFLNVISTPNDQWVIDRDGKIDHLAMNNQICNQSLEHTGTLKGPKNSPRIFNYIKETSFKIITNMANQGYTGLAGIDYIVSNEGIFPVENNARFNGSSLLEIY